MLMAVVFIGAAMFTATPGDNPVGANNHSPDSNGASWSGTFDLVAHDRSGNEIWREEAHNALADEGEQSMLQVYFCGTANPASFYLRLYNDTPAETDALTDLTGEPSGFGYAAIAVERSAVGWPTIALDTGDYQATSKTVTYQASGGVIGPVTYTALATSTDGSGKLISYAALSQTRTLYDGESLDVTYKVKQQ